MAKNCPKCRLTNPDGAQVCDCGYQFETGTMGMPMDPNAMASLTSFEKVACAFGYGIFVYFHYKGIHRNKASQALRYTLYWIPVWVILGVLRVLTGR